MKRLVIGLISALVGLAGSAASASPLEATIVGTVTNEQGAPLPEVTVTLNHYRGLSLDAYETTETDASGRYELSKAPGLYTISFSTSYGASDAYLGEYHPDAERYEDAEPILALPSQTLTIDAQLALGGSIEGTVTDRTGVSLEGVCVLRLAQDDDWEPGHFPVHRTDARGKYRMEGLPTGSYSVRFGDDCEGDTGFRPEWYDDAPTRESGDLVSVQKRQVTGGIDAELDRTPSQRSRRAPKTR